MKTIAIDIREADSSQKAGKANYNLNLTSELIKNKQFNWLLFTDSEHSNFKNHENVKVINLGCKGIKWHFAVKNYLQQNEASAYLAMTSFLTPFLIGTQTKTFVFIHDLICFLFPFKHPLKAVLIERLFLPRILYTSAGFFLVSENTKKDFLQIFKNIDQTKLHIAPCGFVNSSQKSLSTPNTDLPSKYILSVSTILPRKNFHTLIEAFNQIKNSYSGNLLIVGSPANKSYAQKLQNLINKYQLNSRVSLLGFASTTQLEQLYKQADIFVYPSLYEGFGIPVLEAMSHNCPVICANNSSLPDVAAQGALYFDAQNSTDLATKILLLENNQPLQKELKSHYQKQLEKFTWKKTAEKVIENLSK
jgi:glycosyltransferase involved in cell wall biosynthesis